MKGACICMKGERKGKTQVEKEKKRVLKGRNKTIKMGRGEAEATI